MISSTAVFAVSDVEATLAYYKAVLGFDHGWTYGEPPVFGLVSKGGVTITFGLDLELAAKIHGHQHGVRVEDVDEIYRFHVSNGAQIVEEINTKPWAREYVVEDLNGYHLRFSGPPESDAPKSRPFPTGVTIEPRKPTIEEFICLAGYKGPQPDLLKNTWGGVTAKSPEGETIGIVRIMWDAPGWYSIWDVAVLPNWQAQGIGSKMMKQALEIIREASPGANVHLFTMKHGFYERLGFNKDTVSMLRL